jgi:2-succinyl-6-hydroxy-2,4-cyclohexadiene-1-carboxylate synthase
VNSGARRGILFLHGFLGDKDEFRPIGRAFERSHTVAYADLPGHGSSRISANSVETFESIAQRLVQILKTQSCRWHVVGYSLGGRLALYLGCKRPDLVKRLTLLSTSPGIENTTERLARKHADYQLAKAIGRNSLRTFLGHWYRQPLFREIRRHPRFASLLQRRLQGDVLQIQLALKALSVGTQPSLWSEVKKLRSLAAIVCGERDEKFVRIARQMAERNRQMHLEVVAQASHVVHWEAPQRVIEVMQNVENRMENCSPL